MEKIKNYNQLEYEVGVENNKKNRQQWKTPKRIHYPIESLFAENYNPAVDKNLIQDVGFFGTVILKLFAEPFDFFKQVAENWNK